MKAGLSVVHWVALLAVKTVDLTAECSVVQRAASRAESKAALKAAYLVVSLADQKAELSVGS